MSHNNLTRWIENAEARQFVKMATSERKPQPSETQYLHLGEAIARVPSWLRHGIGCDSLTTLGHHALAYVRRPRGPAYD